jgi:hypothetical protein
MRIWDERHLACRVGLFGSPLPADRLKLWGRRNQPRIRMIAGGVLQRRAVLRLAPTPSGDAREVWHYEGTAAEVIRALMPEPTTHQGSRRVS